MERFTNGTRADCLLLDPAEQIGIEVDPGEDQDGQEGVFWTPELDAIAPGGIRTRLVRRPGSHQQDSEVYALNGLATLFGTARSS